MDNGYTPSTVVLDAPIEIDQGPGMPVWAPENYAKKFYGPQTLRFGLEQSRNVMTVRLAQDIGMPLVADYARKFGVYDDMLPVLSMALGAGEILLTSMDRDGTRAGFDIELTRAFSDRLEIPVIASGGVGNLEHLADGVLQGRADAVLAASIFHYGEYTVRQAKEYMAGKGIEVRL